MAKLPLVSIIIVDYKKDNPYLPECLEAIQRQTYKNFEVILVTDHPVTLSSSRKRGSIPSLIKKSFGHYVGPAEKRDWGAKKASGGILAFIDDDAYPHPEWLENIVKNFGKMSFPRKRESISNGSPIESGMTGDIAGVGGPGVTPPNVSWTEEASGWMSASPLGAGVNTYRFFPNSRKFVDDYPSMNLAIRRSDFLAVGGYDSNYWPGEDTMLCLDLTSKLKKKIIYDPNVLVYHHRRPLWKPHLRQNGSFGLHRGFFARVLPQTSFRPIYLGPSFMLLGLCYLIIYQFLPIHNSSFLILNSISYMGWFLFSGYLLALLANSIWVYQKSKSGFQGILAFIVVFITHLWYGARFLQGFFLTKNLSR